VFYRYEDAQGVLHVVDSWSDVPQALQSKAQRIELAPPPPPPASAAPVGRTSAGVAVPSPQPSIDWLSFGLGLGCGALLAVTLFLLRGARPLARIALSLAVAAVLASVVGAAYLGYLRRETGQSSAAISSPAEVVDDARKAVKAMETRNNQQDRVLEEIKREAK